MLSAVRAFARHALCASAVLTLLAGCMSASGRPAGSAGESALLVVPLASVPDTAPAQWRGLSNIFLDTLPALARDSVRMPATWSSAGIDDLVSNTEMQRIPVLRYRNGADTTLQFAVDTTGTFDFTRAPTLTFVRQGKLLVANIALTVRSVRGSSRRVPYQVLRSDDGYTYGRVAEFRSGNLQIDGKPFPVRVRNGGRGRPFYAPNASTGFLVDMNGDGQFAEAAALLLNGQPVAAEQVIAPTPFVVEGQLYEIADIDSTGTALTIRRSNRNVALAVNRRAPEFRAVRAAGGEVKLSEQRGKVVLLSFWATDCPFSDRIRSNANLFVSKYGSKFTWIAMAKDTSRAAIAAYVQKSPINGIVALPDSNTWATYNPQQSTPRFVIVDARGVVQFHAEGASAITVVAAKLDELLVRAK